jgi:GSH-dependent disulfide-bond oxidoreductase
MIDLFTAATMNGRRAALALAECGLEHRVHRLDLDKGDQRKSEFLAINPRGTIPAIVDESGASGTPITVTQSAAIVLYCAKNLESWCRMTHSAGSRRLTGSCTP